MPAPELLLVPANGLHLAVWHWPGPGPTLLFAHATGFHGRCWDQIVRLLPGHRIFAIEARGHGRSDKPDPPYHWRNFGSDLAALAQHLDLRDALAIGHSMGGYAVALAATLHPAAFRNLLLIDPTILPAASYGQPPFDASFTLRRRAVYQSPREMFDRFHQRPPFAQWQPEVLYDYCEGGLLPQDGHFVLACPPPVEASIYAQSNAPESNIHPELARLAQPTVVLRAGTPRVPGAFNLAASPTDPDLAAQLPQARDILLEGHSHYIPMESPALVAAEIQNLLQPS